MIDSQTTTHGNGRSGPGNAARPGGAARALLAALLALMILLGGPAAAPAEPAPDGRPVYVAQKLNEPIYHPGTKSYFELRNDNGTDYIGDRWQSAREKAAGLSYRGTRGRLAVIKSEETHLFLRRNFNLVEEAWIGLRYWCAFRKLQWVTGELHTRQDFNVWAGQWFRDANTKCGAGTATSPQSFMPVYYLPHNFRWQASGPAKKFAYYFVEYPTGAQ